MVNKETEESFEKANKELKILNDKYHEAVQKLQNRLSLIKAQADVNFV